MLQRVLGLIKLSRVADVFAKRLQSPQRLVDDIASALHNCINPAGVAVSLRCSHIYTPDVESIFLDSNNQGWVKLVVSAGSGVFEDKSSDAWSDFASILTLRDSNIDGSDVGDNICECWFPLCSASPPCIETFNPGMTAAATSIIQSLDKDSLRKELAGTPPPCTETFNPGMTAAATSIIQSLDKDSLRKELAGTPARFLKWLMNYQNTNLQINLGNFDLRLINPFKPTRTVVGNSSVRN